MGNDWKRTDGGVGVVNFAYAPAATDVKKSGKTQSHDSRKEKRQKRTEKNQDSNHANQDF